MNRHVSLCAPDAWPSLLEALDREFVFSRGRTLSLAQRYPSALADQPTPSGLRVCVAEGKLASACVVRPFEWQCTDAFRGAMIGCVWTAPDQRGRGHAAFLLRSVADELARNGTDFAVLWSGLNGFYEALGWQRADPGLFAVVTGEAAGARTPLSAINAHEMAAVRRSPGHGWVARGTLDWCTLPLPVAEVGIIRSGDAWALCGEHDAVRYVYETHGVAQAMAGLWPALTAGVARLNINDAKGNPLPEWLTAKGLAAFSPQRLAFWRLFSTRAQDGDWSRWHIPWFDRI